MEHGKRIKEGIGCTVNRHQLPLGFSGKNKERVERHMENPKAGRGSGEPLKEMNKKLPGHFTTFNSESKTRGKCKKNGTRRGGLERKEDREKLHQVRRSKE